MEGLAITPDGKTLVGIMQTASFRTQAGRASQPDGAHRDDRHRTGATKEYGYMLTPGSGVSDIIAINDHEFLVDERDGRAAATAATPSSSNSSRSTPPEPPTSPTSPAGPLQPTPRRKTRAIPGSCLGARTPRNRRHTDPGQDRRRLVRAGRRRGGDVKHTLCVANDNDFLLTTAAIHTPAAESEPVLRLRVHRR